MASRRQWSFSNPGRIAYDPSTSTLWIGQTPRGRNFTCNVIHQDLNGKSPSGTITDAAMPQAIQIHNDGGAWHVYIADNGPDQNVKIFDTSGGVHISTFGATGGHLSSTPGVYAANKLVRPLGIGFDSSNNFYVAGGQASMPGSTGQSQVNTHVRAFNSRGSLLWGLLGDVYIETAVMDPGTDGQDMYTAFNHDKIDCSQLTLGVGGGGTECSHYATTYDPWAYGGGDY